ncbi:MAG: helix-turn-helix transcriptional regulator [Planctomycetaceae bacterium]|nr:helix-turn-helix transcriptional regulator [Planctomycetaceae bacterium]
MIRNETEYREAVGRIAGESQRLEEQAEKLREMGLDSREIRRAMAPMISFHEQLKEEIEFYEKLCRGEFEEVHNFNGLGQLLIALRIAKGVKQRELAERLGSHESQVSRDERNEYHGITIDRAARILDALGVELVTKVQMATHGAP